MFRLIRFLREKYFFMCNSLSFFLMGVEFKEITINGSIFFRCYGSFKYGKNVIINSTFAANPIGGNTFCSIVICKGGELNIGDNVGISNSAIYCTQDITIMDDSLIGGDCKIYDTDFHPLDTKARLQKNNKGKSKPVLIKSGAFIGTGSIILKGTVVGENSIVGAGSVVTGIIPDNEIWAGNPAKFVRKV
jgi:acetyltransferase-like isoleucine patch superfamily enzyme